MGARADLSSVQALLAFNLSIGATMTANTDPIFTGTPKVGFGALSTANANRDGTGTLATVFTAGSNGGRIDKAVVKATVSTSAGMVRLFLHDGAAYHALTEIPVRAVTVGPDIPAFETVIDFLGGLVIPGAYSLRASTHNAEAIEVTAFGGDF